MKNTLAVDNELIRKRRKKRTIKRSLIIFLLLISTLVILCLKLPYFNVESINVVNNKIINSEEIISSSKIDFGINIFTLNTKKIVTNVLSNPYILKADVIRKFPSTILISVEEREAAFYIEDNNKFIILDKNGVILESKDNVNNMNLTKLVGLDVSNFTIGKVIPKVDNRKLDLISLMTDLISLNKTNKSGINITSVNIADVHNVQVLCGNMLLKLGNIDIKDKLNLAFNILVNNNLIHAKGYVDVSFDSSPVVYIEK
ncbi:cell division protein FtsQ/DivIB [Candidatus Clostridium stratigraminis]|uniref:Cell division protein FtsQ/DivIB n=1 Tax=Candidatus Clostridium stratigraminis TaxID=3381661 RepID=A0ABW8T3P9_9CLOT